MTAEFSQVTCYLSELTKIIEIFAWWEFFWSFLPFKKPFFYSILPHYILRTSLSKTDSNVSSLMMFQHLTLFAFLPGMYVNSDWFDPLVPLSYPQNAPNFFLPQFQATSFHKPEGIHHIHMYVTCIFWIVFPGRISNGRLFLNKKARTELFHVKACLTRLI